MAFNKPAGKEWSSAKVDLTGMTNKDKMSTLRFKVSGVGKLVLKFEPAGDQPQAIEKLVNGINNGEKH